MIHASEPTTAVAAGVHALFRMKETARRSDRILEDPFAGRLADELLLSQAIRFGGLALPPLGRLVEELQTAYCVRHRAIDELTLRAIADGFRQVVVVGAGYDMRPSRFAARIGDVRWYELDRPEIIDRKRLRLGRTAVRPYESARLDLDEGSLVDALSPTSFDPDWDTLFVLEGVVPALTLPRLGALVADCARGRGRRRMLMSFSGTEAPPRPDGRLIFVTRVLDEEPRLRITPGHLAALCARHKLLRFSSWSQAQQVETFAREAAERPAGSGQHVAQVERFP